MITNNVARFNSFHRSPSYQCVIHVSVARFRHLFNEPVRLLPRFVQILNATENVLDMNRGRKQKISNERKPKHDRNVSADWQTSRSSRWRARSEFNTQICKKSRLPLLIHDQIWADWCNNHNTLTDYLRASVSA